MANFEKYSATIVNCAINRKKMCLFEILNNANDGWKTDVELSDKFKAILPFVLPHATKSFKQHDVLGAIMKQSFQINSIEAELIILHTTQPFSFTFKPSQKFTGYVYDIFNCGLENGILSKIPSTYSGIYHEVRFENQLSCFDVNAGLTCFLIIAPNSAMIEDFIKISPQLKPFHYKSYDYGATESKLFNRLLNKKNTKLEQSILLHRFMLCHLQQLESIRHQIMTNPDYVPEIHSFKKLPSLNEQLKKTEGHELNNGSIINNTTSIKGKPISADKLPQTTAIKQIISLSRKYTSLKAASKPFTCNR